MRKLVLVVLSPVAALLFATTAFAEDPAELMDIPDPALETIEEHVGEGTVHKIERDTENDEPTFEVEYRTPEGDDVEIEVSEDGDLLEKSEDGNLLDMD